MYIYIRRYLVYIPRHYISVTYLTRDRLLIRGPLRKFAQIQIPAHSDATPSMTDGGGQLAPSAGTHATMITSPLRRATSPMLLQNSPQSARKRRSRDVGRASTGTAHAICYSYSSPNMVGPLARCRQGSLCKLIIIHIVIHFI